MGSLKIAHLVSTCYNSIMILHFFLSQFLYSCFSGNFSFLFYYLIFGIEPFILFHYNDTYFCKVSCNIPSFFPAFRYLSLLSFLISIATALAILFIFPKNQFLVLLVFYFSFSFLYFINFSYNIHYFLPLCPLVFRLSFFLYGIYC